MEDQERETAAEAAKNGLKEEDLELSLGLRPAMIPRRSNSQISVPGGSGDFSLMTVPIWRKECGGAGPEQDSEGLEFELDAKKEAQALRRQEARKKREEKRKSKANSNERLLWFEKQRELARENEDDFSERRRKGARKFNGNEVEGAVLAPEKSSFLVKPTNLNGASYYAMMPGLVGSDGQANQSVTGGGCFQPYQMPEKTPGNDGGNMKKSVSGCSRGSSSGVSDHRCTSGQGKSSSDSGSHSSHSQHPEPTISTKSQTAHIRQPHSSKPECTTFSCDNTKQIQSEVSPDKKLSQRPSAVTGEAKGISQSKPTEPPVQQANEAMLLSQMPYVSTTGNGPNGKTITGFLYKYSHSEVCIVCVCHGSSFSPSGFVEHAGGVDVEHPLRHITVVPFALS